MFYVLTKTVILTQFVSEKEICNWLNSFIIVIADNLHNLQKMYI